MLTQGQIRAQLPSGAHGAPALRLDRRKILNAYGILLIEGAQPRFIIGTGANPRPLHGVAAGLV